MLSMFDWSEQHRVIYRGVERISSSNHRCSHLVFFLDWVFHAANVLLKHTGCHKSFATFHFPYLFLSSRGINYQVFSPKDARRDALSQWLEEALITCWKRIVWCLIKRSYVTVLLPIDSSTITKWFSFERNCLTYLKLRFASVKLLQISWIRLCLGKCWYKK